MIVSTMIMTMMETMIEKQIATNTGKGKKKMRSIKPHQNTQCAGLWKGAGLNDPN